jgi:hypothetical protein
MPRSFTAPPRLAQTFAVPPLVVDARRQQGMDSTRHQCVPHQLAERFVSFFLSDSAQLLAQPREAKFAIGERISV